ncbi:hypothetical protein NEOKW01_0827 [Nematocida sp. AWRm80]|nr:hypothetical protein NEOKW01_0827 [Nematocida sp. AWRm80]
MNIKGEEWNEYICSADQCINDLSESTHREDILKGLEEEFRKGILEVQKVTKMKSPGMKTDMLFNALFIPRKGHQKWETARRESIRNIPITKNTPAKEKVPEERSNAFKINLKENILFFNIVDTLLLVATESGTIKIYQIKHHCKLDKLWEMSNTLFMYLFKTGSISSSVADTLSQVLLLLFSKRIKNIEKVFEEFILFCRITTVKKAFFFNGYLCMISSFGEMQIFDESLREIPLGKNLKQIIHSILKEPTYKKERYNYFLQNKEITMPLTVITIKLSKDKIKLIYSKKSIYEEIYFSQIEQLVYTDNTLFLKEMNIIHVITFK